MLGALQNIFYMGTLPKGSRSRQTPADDGARQNAQPSPCCIGQVSDSTTSNQTLRPDNTVHNLERQGLNSDGWDSIQSGTLQALMGSVQDLDTAREKFLRTCGDDHGYGGQLESVRRAEFRRLAGQAYLDYAGAALYSELQVQESSQELLNTLLCNPHSGPGSASAEATAALRQHTLELLNADGRQYDVVITSGATAALKMVAECFPWSAGASRLAHPAAVHNSVLGMRGPALARGAVVQLVQLIPAQLADAGRDRERQGTTTVSAAAAAVPASWHLLTLPAECNFTGDREPLADVVRHVQRHGISAAAAAPSVAEDAGDGSGDGSGGGGGGRWLVLLDAAKACATAPPDLSAVPADFVVLSYYKIFGYPTGLGALVARKEALALLAGNKSYFGGGTVEVAVADRPYHVRRRGAPGLEDGTLPFTSIAAARHGFAFLRRLGGLPAVHRHSRCLVRWLAAELAALCHSNGAPACVMYGKWCAAAAAGGSVVDHGPTLSFNLLRPDGSWVGYAEVGRLAAMHGMVLRTGCFCNPGACAEWLGLSAEDVIRHHRAGHVCWDDHDLVDGRPTGAVRVSLGAVSNFDDVYALLQLITRYFVYDGSGGDGDDRRASSATAHPPALETPRESSVAAAACSVPPAEAEQEEEEPRTQPPSTALPSTPPPAAAVAELHSVIGNPLPRQYRPASDASSVLKETPLHPSHPRAVLSQLASCGHDTGLGSSIAVDLGPGGVGGGGGSGGCASSGTSSSSSSPMGRLSRILLYPVKSCAAQVVAAWPIGPTGLLYDREWALVDDSGKVLTLKQCPRMALVRPLVDLIRGTLTIHAPYGACIPPLELAIPGLFRRCGDAAGTTNGTTATTGAAAARECEVASVAAKSSATAAEAEAAAEAAKGCGSASDGVVEGGTGHPAVAATATEQPQPRAAAGVRRREDAVRLDAGLSIERVQVCGDTVCSDLVDICHDSVGDNRVRQWFGRALGAPCRIVQQRAGARKVRRPAGQRAGTVAVPASGSASASASDGAQDRLRTYQQHHRHLQLQQRQMSNYGGVGSEGLEPAVTAGGDGGGEEKSSAVVGGPSVGFANDGQYLLVSEASMDDLRTRLRHGKGAQPGGSAAVAADSGAEADDDLVTRLRPNLVVSGFPPYEEDSWAAVSVGPLWADVLGTCPRCELLQVDPRVGVRRGAEVLVALAQYRRRGGRLQFGVLLAAATPSPSSSRSLTSAAAAAAVATAEVMVGAEVWKQRAGACEGGILEAATVVPAAAVPRLTAATATTVGGRRGSGVAADWLRQEFGQLSVVAVGDPVLPTAAVGAAR